MSVYKLGPSPSGGFRTILPPDPKPPSKVGKVLAFALTFGLGLLGGVGACMLLDDRTNRLQQEKSLVLSP